MILFVGHFRLDGETKMKKISTYKGFVIAQSKEDGCFAAFTQEEWSMGEGFRYPEMEGFGTIEFAKDFIKNY